MNTLSGSSLSDQEKISLFQGADNWHTAQIRGKVPSILMTDGPNGLRIEQENGPGFNRSLPAIAWPTASALACTFDRSLLYELGEKLSEECRQEGVDLLLGPGVNHKRSPLGGRNFEYFSEDPVLSGELSSAYIRGLQDHGIGSSLKHFAGNSREFGRLVSDSLIDERALHEIYLRQFEIAVRKASPWTMMMAYNRLNGVYCAEHASLMALARDRWQFRGVFISDWGAVSNPVRSLQAGLNLEMPGGILDLDHRLLQALQKGDIREKQLTDSTDRVLSLISQCQAKDTARSKPYDLSEHMALARRAAAQSAVLLRNSGILPMAADSSIALIGPGAVRPRLGGAGSSRVEPLEPDSLAEAMAERHLAFSFTDGYDPEDQRISSPNDASSACYPLSSRQKQRIEDACRLASDKDIAILVLALPEKLEGEGYDRANLSLPDSQNALVCAVCQANPNTVVLLQCGSPVLLPWRDQVKGLLLLHLAGCRGGHAALDLLLGDVTPSGHLAESWPLRLEDTPAFHDFNRHLLQVQYRESIYTGYRYYATFSRKTAYPFGHGLSYTDFAYEHLQIIPKIHIDKYRYDVSLCVTNTGAYPGRAVPQLYVSMPQSRIPRPVRELKDFASLYLEPGETKQICFQLTRDTFTYYDVSLHDWAVETGDYQIQIGLSSEKICLEDSLSLEGTSSPYSRLTFNYIRWKDGTVTIPKSSFEQVLGRTVPKRRSPRPFTADTTVTELADVPLGRLVNSLLRLLLRSKRFRNDRGAATIFEQPLRTLLSLHPRVTWDTVDGAADLMNGRHVKGLRQIIRSLRRKDPS